MRRRHSPDRPAADAVRSGSNPRSAPVCAATRTSSPCRRSCVTARSPRTTSPNPKDPPRERFRNPRGYRAGRDRLRRARPVPALPERPRPASSRLLARSRAGKALATDQRRFRQLLTGVIAPNGVVDVRLLRQPPFRSATPEVSGRSVSIERRCQSGSPLTTRVTSMLSRVALEYGQIRWAVSTRSTAWSWVTEGSAMHSSTPS